VALPIRVLTNSFEDVVSSARLKAQYPLSFADCFAASTARRENAIIMTGDPEFENLEHMVEIEWL
jgi:ribonuclease VapC